MKKSHQSKKAFQSTQAGDVDIINQILATFSDPESPELRSWGHVSKETLFKNIRKVLKPIPGRISLAYQTPVGGGAAVLVRVSNAYRSGAITKEFVEALNAADIRVCSIQLVFHGGKSTRDR